MKNRTTLLLGSALLTLLSPAAFAQNSGGSYIPTTSTVENGLDEIVVTARRRSEDISRVPATLSALSAEDLAERSIINQSDLQATVPGLIVRETMANNNLNYAIRGQTVDAFSYSPTAVAPYVNEVPFIALGVNTFFDLESVQVLKGPQGTLFGRNATGGAVLSTTKRPDNEMGGYIQAGLGNYSSVQTEGALNIPIIDDTLLFRGAFNTIDRDGYIDNVYEDPFFGGVDSSELGKVDRKDVRASLLFQPNDQLENLSVFQYGRSKGNNSGTQIYSLYECGDTQPSSSTPLACPADFVYPGMREALRRQQEDLDFWEVDSDQPSVHDGENWFFTNTTEYDFGSFTLKNIFGYSDADSLDATGQTGEPFLLISNYNLNSGRIGNLIESKSWSNELQLNGTTLNDNLVYTAGIYLQEIDSHSHYSVTVFSGGVVYDQEWDQGFSSEAVYGHLTYNLTDQLSLSAGARYSWEEVTVDHLAGDTFFGGASNSVDFDKPSWNLGLEYQLNEDTLLYITTRESWRSGGINAGTAPPIAAFEPEVAQDIEAGLKYNGITLGVPTKLFLSGYKMQVEDIQRVLYPTDPDTGTVFSLTSNVPEAEIKGLELDIAMSPSDWVDVGLTAALADAEFTDNTAIVLGQPFEFGPVADIPQNTVNLYTSVRLPVSEELGDMRLRADLYNQSKMYFSNANNYSSPETQLPGYTLINLNYDWSNIYGSDLSLGAWVKNLMEEEYYTGGLSVGTAFGINSANVGRPRMYGVKLRYDF